MDYLDVEFEMPGFPSLLWQRLQKTLPLCGVFNSDSALRGVFWDARLNLWRAGLPEEANTAARVTGVISYLYGRSNKAGENGLFLLLQVLRDSTHPEDDLNGKLESLAVELEQLQAEACLAAQQKAAAQRARDLAKLAANNPNQRAAALSAAQRWVDIAPDDKAASDLLAELIAREEADRKAKEEAERKAKEEADRKAQAEADRKAKKEAERKAKEEADRKVQAEAERKAKEEADRKAQAEAAAKALQAQLAGLDPQPNAAVDPTRMPPLRQRLPGWLKPVGIGLAVVVVLGLLIGVFGPPLWGAIVATPTPTPTRRPPTQTPKPTATNTPAPPTNTPSITPSATPEPTVDSSRPPACTTPGATWTRPTDEMTLLCVPGGKFQMGSETGSSNEKPVHSVTLSAFWIDQTEVTNAHYRKCVKTGKCDAPTTCTWGTPTYDNADKANHPVVCVSWQGAVNYCTWTGGQLPTEAQWEYAARGPEGFVYPWGNDWRENVVNCLESACKDGYLATAPVGSFLEGKSWVGALDMAGNVWEWTADWYAEYPSESQMNPEGPMTGDSKVMRGGAWSNNEYGVHSTYRDGDVPAGMYGLVGFRCVIVRAQD